MEFWAFFDISDKPIKIQTLSTPQNDRLDLLFMKDVYVGAKKWPEMVLKKSFMSSEFCATVSMLYIEFGSSCTRKIDNTHK